MKVSRSMGALSIAFRPYEPYRLASSAESRMLRAARCHSGIMAAKFLFRSTKARAVIIGNRPQRPKPGRETMFLPVDNAKHRTPMPLNSSIREQDWQILASFWHPVAYAHDVGDKPVAARLLDVGLVVWRTSAGISVARDTCPHRGTRLSAGWVRNDVLICPMHGLHFDGAGQCRRIPSIADPNAHIPPSFRLQTVKSQVHYGIVWACLSGEPIWPLPRWDGIDDPDLEKVYFRPETWMASAGRHVENFNDLTHFPWVHIDSFGGDEDAPT